MIWALSIILYLFGFLGCFAFITVAEEDDIEPSRPRTILLWSLAWPIIAVMGFVAVLWGHLASDDDHDDSNGGEN